MTTDTEWIEVSPESLLHVLQQEAVDKVKSAQGEVVLDFSAVPRVDSDAVVALEHLAALGAERSVTVVLRAVNGDIYKVLKLMKLTGRFSFVS
jgi:anti-anti-sigma regulatory factor